MNALSVIWKTRSTNGRWGAEIVSEFPVPSLDQGGCNAIRWPLRGRLTPLGKAAGIDSFRFDADESAPTWVLPGGDLRPIEGATEAWSQYLQSNASGTILVLGAIAILKNVGYKGRSAHFVLYQEGERQDAPASVLLALGLIEPKEPPPPIAAPPAPSGALQDALRRAGMAV